MNEKMDSRVTLDLFDLKQLKKRLVDKTERHQEQTSGEGDLGSKVLHMWFLRFTGPSERLSHFLTHVLERRVNPKEMGICSPEITKHLEAKPCIPK